MKGASRNLATLFYAPRRFFQARAEDRGGIVQATAFAFGIVLCVSVAEWDYERLGWSFSAEHVSESLGHFLLMQSRNLATLLVTLSGAIYLALYGLGSARASFSATYRVCAYSSVAFLFGFIPWIGSPIAGNLAWIWILIVGLVETHGISKGRAFVVSAMALLRVFVVVVLTAMGATALLYRR